MQYWGWNPGLLRRYASVLQTEPHAKPLQFPSLTCLLLVTQMSSEGTLENFLLDLSLVVTLELEIIGNGNPAPQVGSSGP